MSTRRAIVHIGTPRTGTTTLQRILFRHRAALAGQGILYPDLTPASASEPHLSHQHLGEALAGRRAGAERAELLDRLAERVGASDCDTVLLSYEGLCLIAPASVTARRLAALFARRGMRMETLLTVKPQAEYLNSTYTWRMQFLREARSFAAFLRARLAARDCDYDRLATPWREACDGRLIAVPVRDSASGDPLAARVFAALGLADRFAAIAEPADLALVENPSPGPVAIEICRRLCAGGAAFALGDTCRAATRFVEQAVRAHLSEDAAAFSGHDDASRALVARHWRRSNDRFAAAAWSAPWDARVAEAPPRPMNELLRQPFCAATEAMVSDIARQAAAAFGVSLVSPARARLRAMLAAPVGLAQAAERRLRSFVH